VLVSALVKIFYVICLLILAEEEDRPYAEGAIFSAGIILSLLLASCEFVIC